MLDTVRWRLLLVALAGWVNRHQLEVIAYLREENRVLKEQLGGRHPRLTDPQRRRLAATGYRLGRQALTDVATIVTPDTILRWHRQLIARKWTTVRRRVGRPGVLREIRALTVRMARENPTCGYRRIQGALKNLGHRVARSTIAGLLRAEGIGPVPERPTSWRTFLAAHCGAIAAADFFTTEVWTARGLITYYTLFVIDLASRRVQIVGSTPHPDQSFVLQMARTVTDADDGFLRSSRILICDRDTKWSAAVRQTLEAAGIRMAQSAVSRGLVGSCGITIEPPDGSAEFPDSTGPASPDAAPLATSGRGWSIVTKRRPLTALRIQRRPPARARGRDPVRPCRRWDAAARSCDAHH